MAGSNQTTAELAARLRSRAETVDSASTSEMLSAAADEIERLRSIIRELQETRYGR